MNYFATKNVKGKTKTKTKRTKRKTKSGGDYSMFLPFMAQNRLNFNLWNKKNPETYKTFNEELYYPNPYNILSMSGIPMPWTERVKKHCNGKTTISGSTEIGECIKKYCSPKINHASCKNNDQYGIKLY